MLLAGSGRANGTRYRIQRLSVEGHCDGRNQQSCSVQFPGAFRLYEGKAKNPHKQQFRTFPQEILQLCWNEGKRDFSLF